MTTSRRRAKEFLGRREVCQRARREFGIDLKPHRLANAAYNDTGPKFVKVNGRALYEWAAVLPWLRRAYPGAV